MNRIQILYDNTSLNKTEAIQFVEILSQTKDISEMSADDILKEFWDNWSIYDNYEEAWEEEQIFDYEAIEEKFRQRSWVLDSGRCLVRDYI